MASGPFINLYIQLLYKIADYVLAKSVPSLYTAHRCLAYCPPYLCLKLMF